MCRKLLYIFLCLLSFSQRITAQDCELPQLFTGNTGSNMTVFFTSGAINALPISSDVAYIVAFSPDGLMVGSASVASADLIGGQQSLAVWGDDTATPEVDGAISGDVLTFQLVDGTTLYDLDLSFAGINSFTANGQLPVIVASAELNCSGSDPDPDPDSDSSLSCDLPQQFSGNTGSNMTVFFTSGAIDALSISSDVAYIVALSPDGLIVGSASVASDDLIGGQQSIAVWGDDTATPEVDGAITGDALTFQLVNGNSLFDLNLSFAGLNSFVANGQLPVINSSTELNCTVSSYGCMDSNACNYDSSATIDDGSCDGSFGCMDSLYLEYDADASCDNGICSTLIVEGCTDNSYLEYDSTANTDDGSCNTEIITGCTSQLANNYNPNANSYDGSCIFDSDVNHIFVSSPIDGSSYESGSDLFINYEFISTDITIGYPFNGGDALIRYSINDGPQSNIANATDEISLGALLGTDVPSDGDYTIVFTLHSSGSGLPQWDPLVQTTVNIAIGPAGCTDEIACNYDSEAVVNNYSCIYPPFYYDCSNTCITDIDNDLVCDELEILGCQDQSAVNFDPTATDAGFCDYFGCTDSLYVEFNPIATIDDQTCETIAIFGCMDVNSFNYNSIANVDDFSCYNVVNGCMDTLAFNFNDYDYDGYPNPLTGILGIDVNTAVDDCDFYGCMQPDAENYDPLANINFASIDSFGVEGHDPCIYLLIPGCTDEFACNFSDTAESDDGSCLYVDICGECGGTGPTQYYDCDGTCTYDTDGDGVCNELEILDCQDTLAVNYNSLATDSDPDLCDYLGCTDNLYFEFDPNSTINDGSCETLIVYGCTNQDYLEYSITANFDNGSCETIVVYGCILPIADNFNSNANVDNGSCIIPGCIDPFAQNTDPLANYDDGSCLYEAIPDTSGNSNSVLCNLPSSDYINTGSNMTVMLTETVLSSFPENLSNDAYVVAIAENSQITIGSADVYGETLIQLVLWGDDSTTPNIDGAVSGESILYQLVNGDELYDINISWNSFNISYVTNNIIFGLESSIDLNCSSSSQDNQVIGCMNPIACNYNLLATSPSSCTYSNIGYDCDGNCLIDSDLDGVCDEFEVDGCSDFLAFNFNPYSTEDGNCEYLGCTDSLYVEFNPIATIDDQSCETFIIAGCLDINADNYNSNANLSDNTCSFNNINNPYIQVLINSDIPEDAYLEGEDIFIEYNFYPGNEDITVSYPASGNAIIRLVIDGGVYTTLFAPFAPGHSFSDSLFLDSFDFENGTHTIEFTLYSSDPGLPIWDPFVQTLIEFEIGSAGCTDPNAGNYIPSAVVDNGSCIDDAGIDFDSEVINTGSNHTIYIPADVVFPEVMDFNQNDLLGAFYLSDGYPTLGSEMVFDESVNDGSFQIIVFGDDLSTPEADGFFDGQEFIWAYQDTESGNSLFLSPIYQNTTASNSFINDGIFVVTSFEILFGLTGCVNPDYLEYNALPFIEEDTTLCQTPVVFGCMNDTYCEYNPSANTDDGSCFGLPGCLDEAFIEFDAGAFCDDGSCSELVIEGCTDNLAENYDSLANTQIDVCIYDVCVQFDVNNFVIEYSDFLGEIVLSFDIFNTSDDKTIYAPEFEINLNSSIVELGLLSYNIDSLSFNEYNSATVSAIITNDSLSEFDPLFEMLSGVITLSSDSVFNGLSDTANCSLHFNDEILVTSHLGCTNESAFNFDSLATINNGTCIDNLNAIVVSNTPSCYNDYGSAFLYLTGGIPPYSLSVDNSITYTSYSELGIPNEVPVNINSLGVAEFIGLYEGVYSIEVQDDVGAIFNDSIIITLPQEIQVDVIVQDDLLLTSSSNTEPTFYQWLLNGQSVLGANSNFHYPEQIGNYQIYIEDVYGCSVYSEEVFLPEIGLNEFDENSFKIYPNPANSSISIYLNNVYSSTIVSITNVLGQEFKNVKLNSESSNQFSVDVSDWPDGFYLVNLNTGSRKIVTNFVKY